MHLLTNSTLTKKDLDLAISVIKSEKITKGKYTDSVEKKFTKMLNRYSLFINSGSSTNVLFLSLIISKYLKKHTPKLPSSVIDNKLGSFIWNYFYKINKKTATKIINKFNFEIS